VKFLLFVEGDTEHRVIGPVLKRWLDSQLNHAVGVQPVRFKGWADFDREVEKKARMHLNGPKQDQIIAVIGLLDLYGPDFYPGDRANAQERRTWAIKHFEERIDDQRFRMFFAVHELEAWLLADPHCLPTEIRRRLGGRPPEDVNFGEPPAKLLDRLYNHHLKRGYRKMVDGTNRFRALDIDRAYDACPALRAMLDAMLELAQPANA